MSGNCPEAPARLSKSEVLLFQLLLSGFTHRHVDRCNAAFPLSFRPPRRTALLKARDEAFADTMALKNLVPPQSYYFIHVVDILRRWGDLELEAIDARIANGDRRSAAKEYGELSHELTTFVALAILAISLLWDSRDTMDPSPRDATMAWGRYVSEIVRQIFKANPKMPGYSGDKKIEAKRAHELLHLVNQVTECIPLTRSLYPPVCLTSAHELLISSLERYLAGLIGLRNGELEVFKAERRKSAALMKEAEGILISVKKEHGW